MSTELEKALQMLNDEENDENSPLNKLSNTFEINLEDFILNTIKANLCSTIGIKYELGDVYVTCVYPSKTKLEKFSNYNEEEYYDFCKKILRIDRNEEFNCSRTVNVSGVRTRVYSVMPPLVKTPNITISTTKEPPAIYNNKQTIEPELLNKIVHSNFVIVGASGSGKTYLLNYLLSNFIKENERLALIEEFGELIPPNAITNSIIVPPPKPGEESLLKFVTEQSNLMRLDKICVGEVKGAEAWPMVVNMASGTSMCCTLHGQNARQALSRLRALCRMSCDNDAAIDEFIAKSIDYIIVMKNRNIEEIQQLTHTVLNGNFQMKEVAS